MRLAWRRPLGAERFAGDEHGYGSRLRGRERLALFGHLAGGERGHHLFGSQQAQGKELRRAPHAFIVALRAMLLIHRVAVLRQGARAAPLIQVLKLGMQQ